MWACNVRPPVEEAAPVGATEVPGVSVRRTAAGRALKADLAAPTSSGMLGILRRWVGRTADWAIWHTAASSAVFWDRHYAAGGT